MTSAGIRELKDNLSEFLGELVEQLMQGDKLRPFHIPMRLLGLQPKVQHVGQILVKQINHLAADGFREVDARGIKFGFHN